MHSTGRPHGSSDTPVSAACERSPRPPSKETRRDSHPRTRPSSSGPHEQDRHSSDDDTSAPTPDITASAGRSHNTGPNWDDILGRDSPPPDDRSRIRHRGGGSDIGARSQRGLQNRKEKDKVGGTLWHKRMQTTKNDPTRSQSHNTLAHIEVGRGLKGRGTIPAGLRTLSVRTCSSAGGSARTAADSTPAIHSNRYERGNAPGLSRPHNAMSAGKSFQLCDMSVRTALEE